MAGLTPGRGTGAANIVGGPATYVDPERAYVAIGDAGAASGIDVASGKYTVDGKKYSWAEIMTAIAGAESSYQSNNQGDLQYGRYGSVGLWQIFTGAHSPSEVGLGGGTWNQNLLNQLADPATNAQAAVDVYKAQGFNAWTTYRNGAYKAYLGKAQSAASGAGGQAVGLDTPIASPTGVASDAANVAGDIGSALLAPFKEIGSAVKAGGLRIGYGIVGFLLVLYALRMIGKT